MVNLSLWNRKYILNRKKLWLLILKSYSNLSPRPYMIFVSQGFESFFIYTSITHLVAQFCIFEILKKLWNFLKEIQTANTARPPTYHGQCLSLSALFTQGTEYKNFSFLIFQAFTWHFIRKIPKLTMRLNCGIPNNLNWHSHKKHKNHM